MNPESAKSTLRVIAAEIVATGMITGFDVCEQEGWPLTQMQQISMMAMGIMASREGVNEGELAIDADVVLQTVILNQLFEDLVIPTSDPEWASEYEKMRMRDNQAANGN